MARQILAICRFLIFAFIPLFGYGQQPIPYFQNLSVENGLPDNRITNVIQDDRGFLWVTTRFGINRYDGAEAKSYSLQGNPGIAALFLDKEGKPWVATSKGIFYYNRNTDLYERYNTRDKDFNAALQSHIVEIFQSRNGKIWFTNREGQLACFTPGQDKNEKIYNIRSSPVNMASWAQITAIEEDYEGYLWLGSNAGDLRLFDPATEKFITTEFENSFLGSHINDIAIDTTNQMWIATNNIGVYRFILDSGNSIHYKHSGKNHGNSINNNIVLSLMVDSKNNVWMGTDGGGLNLYRAERDEFLYFKRRGGTEASLSDNSILSISKGLHNIIWLGTVHGGISYFKNNLSIQNIPPEKLSFNADRQGSRIFEDSRGNFWISAGRDGLRKYNPTTGEISSFTDTDSSTGFSGKIVLSIMEDSYDRIWIGTLYEGFNVYDIKKERFLEVPGNKDLNGVLAIEEQENGMVWVGSDMGIRVYNSSLDMVKLMDTQSGEGLSHNVVSSIYKDAKGDMWVGTINGLNVLSNNQERFKTYFSVKSDSSTLSSNHILSIAEGSDLSVWVGTYGFGANRFSRSSEKFERIDKEDGLAGNIVQGILMDQSNNIWLSTNLGLSKVGEEGITNYGNKEGVPAFNGSSVSISKNGRMFFAGEKGLFHFRPEELKTDTIAPRPFFRGIQVLREEGVKEITFGELGILEEDGSKISIQPDDKSMLVFFGSSNFWNPEKNNYSYRLKGLSEEWHTVGLQQSLSFSNLPPDEYTLEVRVANELGIWSPYTASLDFKVLPSFWQKAEVQILGFLFFISAILLLIRWRSNYQKAKHKKLQDLIDRKTVEVKLQKDRVFKKNMDLLKAENENEKLKQKNLLGELNYRKEELTNNTLRNVHKNNLLAKIKDSLKKEINRDPRLKPHLKDIIGHIDDSLALDKDWEAFYHLFGQVHPAFIEDLKIFCPKLSDRDIKLCALIKLNFSSQHMATLFGISLSSVKVARYRLRKKMDIPEGVSFEDFLEKEVIGEAVVEKLS